MMKRERNNAIMLQCDNTGMRECFSAAMQECHRAWSMEHGARGKGEAAGFGWRLSHTIVPLEKGGGDFGAGGFLINNSLLLIAYFLFPENVKYRIRNQKTGNEGVTVMLQCRMDRVFALKGQVISAQGNALGWKGTRTPAPWFSASNPVANVRYKFQQVRVNPLQVRVNPLQGQVNPLQVRVATLQGGPYFQQVRVATLQGSPYFQQVRVATLQGGRYFQQVRVATLQGSPYFQQVRVATLQGGRYFQQVRVATLQGSRYFQQGTVSAVSASVYNSLFLIAYFLFPENVKYRIRNHQSGIEGMTAMQECHRAWSMEHGAKGKGEAAGFGWRLSHTIVPLEKGGGDFGAGGFLIYNSLFLIAYFLFPENVKYRIRNHQSGIEGMSYKLNTTYPFPNYRDRQLQTRGRGAGGLNRGHKRPAAKSQWPAYEIQFSRYPASGGTVIHGRRQLGPACCPFYIFFN